MKDYGLVSIIMPSYNTAKYIIKSVDSILNQSYKNWELIIVDDCSTDDTDEVIKPYLEDKRIKYLKNDKNSGAAISRNRAIKESTGKWIAFLDSDDLWVENKLISQLEFMVSNNFSFSYTKYREIDEHWQSLNREISGPKHITKVGMYSYCWPGCLTVMYDSTNIGKIQISDLKKNNDYAMWLKIIKHADCYLLDECLGYYMKRNGSISNQSILKLIKHHYYLFRYGEHKNILFSILLTGINLAGGVYKKIIFKREV